MNPGGPNAKTHAGHFPGTVARTDRAHARSARTRKKARRAAAYRSAATTAPAQEEPSRGAPPGARDYRTTPHVGGDASPTLGTSWISSGDTPTAAASVSTIILTRS